MAELGILMKAHDEASSVMKNVGLVAIGLGTALAGGAALAVKAAAAEQVGMVQLERAIRNTGVTSQGAIAAAEKQVTAWQNMSGVADDEIRPAFALLIAQTGSLEEATRRMPMALDLQRAANIDLATSARTLGKLDEEHLTALNRMGFAFKKGATEAEVFAAIQAKVGGQSADFAKTAVGQWEILQHTIGDFVEAVGFQLLPMVTTGIGIIGELFGVITGTAPEAGGKLRAAIGGPMAEAIMGALAAMRDTAQLIFKGDFPALIQHLITFVGDALPKIRDQLLQWGKEFIAWVAPQIPKLLGELLGLLGKGLDWIDAHAEEIGAELVKWGIKFGEFIRDSAIPALVENLPSIIDFLIAFATTVPAKIQKAFMGVGKGIVDAIGAAVRESWNGIADAFRYMLTQAIQAIDFWVGPFHISGLSGITVSMPQISLPTFSLPSFDSGGIVPGPIGSPQLVVAHGGEEVRTQSQQAAGGGGGGDLHVHFHGNVYGMSNFKSEVANAVKETVRAGGLRGVLQAAPR